MRRAFLLGILLLALLPAATAQPTFSQAYQLRAGIGDLATTPAHEPSVDWNVEQRLAVKHTAGKADTITLTRPAGATVVAVTCDCNVTTDTQASAVTFVVGAQNAAGRYTVALTTSQPAATAFAFSVAVPTQDSVAIVYVPTGSQADAASASTTSIVSTDGTSTITVYGEGSGLPASFWAAVHPTTTTAIPSAPAAAFPWLWVGVAFVAGAIVWSLLVSRGAVQARSRKQVVATAAHVEAARDEPVPVLEGRKRALMAALKEIEVAKMNSEMDAAVYDTVKADFKKQAVTVMRALETGSSQAK